MYRKRNNMKKNHILIIICIIITIILVISSILGILSIHTEKDELPLVDVEFSARNIIIKQGEQLSTDINDYLNETIDQNILKNFELDISKVDINVQKIYNYSISYNNTTKFGTIEVISARYMQTKDLYLEKGSTFEKNNLIRYTDVSNYKIKLLNEEELNLNSPGDYSLSFEIIEQDGATREFISNVYVYESEELHKLAKQDLSYAYDLQYRNLNIEENEIYWIFEEAIKDTSMIPDDFNLNLNEDLKKYSDNKYDVIYLYNKYGYIMGIAVKINEISNSIYNTEHFFLTRS